MFQSEREFVKTAKACLQGLTAQPCAPGGLETIIESAKSVQARAVMLAAERCLLPARENRLAAAFELRTLSRLVGQFEEGLVEIDPGAAGYIAGEPSAAPFKPIEPIAANPQFASEKIETATPKARASRAAATLENVLPFAPASDRAALDTLLRLGQGEAIKTKSAPPAQTNVLLENLIAPVTSDALVAAHRAHKQLSLSYACEHVSVPGHAAPALQALLMSVCGALIDISLRHPAAREAAGLPATGQIAITASETARGLSLDIFCDDLAVARDDFLTRDVEASLKAYRDTGGDFTYSQGRAAGVMLAVTHSGAPRPAANASPVLHEAIA